MAHVTLGGNPSETIGELPAVGSKAPNFNMRASDLSPKSMSDYEGGQVVMNFFPSIDTGVCAASTRRFNEAAAKLNNTKVLCISRDLPFAHARFCGAEGIENVEMLSDFEDGQFGKDYGLELISGGFKGLHSRAVVVLDTSGNVVYTEQVPEIGQEPNYEAALAHIS